MTKRTNTPVVAITGASSGIGKATALAFAREGARLALCARREAELEATASACRDLGSEVVWTRTDVGEEAQVQAFAQLADEAFGRIDVWFNNAGVDAFGTFAEIPAYRLEEPVMVDRRVGKCLPHMTGAGWTWTDGTPSQPGWKGWPLS